jgi:hypothetical protein
MKEALAEALDHLRFPGKELAYLALTSKPENPFRDRLAWQLHQERQGPDFWVAREWSGTDDMCPGRRNGSRTDLAVLDRDGLPRALLVAVATGSFNRRNRMIEIENDLREDLRLAKEKAPQTPLFGLLVVTHTLEPVCPGRPVPGLITSGDERGYETRWSDVEEFVDSFLGGARHDGPKAIRGTAFAIDVCIYVWLWGALDPDNDWSDRPPDPNPPRRRWACPEPPP